MSVRSDLGLIKRLLSRGPLFFDGEESRPQLIVIRGGLSHDTLHGSVGGVHLQARPHESREQFSARLLDEAAERGEQYAVLGGLVPPQFGD
jgi:hypothetical protein